MPIIDLIIDASGAVKGMRKYVGASRKGEQATESLADSSKKSLDKMVKSFGATASAAVSVGVAIQQIGKSLTIFSDFDDQLRIAAAYAGATSEQFIIMGKAAAEAGASTSKTASQAAQGFAEFAARGFTVQEQLKALVPAIRLSEAAQVDLARATEVSSGILRGLGKDVSYLSRINDIIVGISGASAANINFVGEAAKYAVPAARAVGEEFETVAAILGTLADQQFEAGQSGNAFKNFLISLTGPTSATQATLDKLGVSTRDANGEFLGLVNIFKQLNAANLDLTDSTAIFGKYFTTAGLAVTKSIGEVEKDLGYLKNGIDGITESTAEFQQAGLGGSFRRLGSAVEAVYLAVGDQLAPIIIDATRLLTDFAGNASKVASATSGIIGVVRIIANTFGVFHTAASGVNIVLGEIYEWIWKTFHIVNKVLGITGIAKIFGFNIDASDAIAEIEKFNDTQVEGFKSVTDNFGKVNRKFDEYQRNLKKNLSTIKQTTAAERALATAADNAATAAGKQAIAAGKSVEAALKAAETAKKVYIASTEAAKQQEEADKKAAQAAEKRRAALEKHAATVKEQAISYGATESAAEEAADKIKRTAEEADEISDSGTEKLNASLDRTKTKANDAQIALANLGGQLPAGEVNYAVNIKTDAYEKKISDMKEETASLFSRGVEGLFGFIVSEAAAAELPVSKLGNSLAEVGKAADKAAEDGVVNLKDKLQEASEKADKAKKSLESIGEATGGGGRIAYEVGLNTAEYDRKINILKDGVKNLNESYNITVDLNPKGAEDLKIALDSAKKQLKDTQAIRDYEQQLRSLREQYGKVKQEFLGGKLEVITDRVAEENLRKQMHVVNDLKLAVDGVVPGMERINGVWQQMPSSVATAVVPAAKGLGDMANASGEIELTWKNIDGVWKQVLPDGTVLVQNLNGELSAGAEIMYGYGEALAGAVTAAQEKVSSVELALKSVESQVIKTQNAAGSLKLDKLATLTGASNLVGRQIAELRKKIRSLDPASEAAAEAVKKLLSAEAVKDELYNKISELKDEIYTTGEEAKKTSEKIKSIPAVAKEVASAVEDIAKANVNLADTVNRMGIKAGKKTYTWAAPDTSTIEGIEKYISLLKETKRAMEGIGSYTVDTSATDREIEGLLAKIESMRHKQRILAGTESVQVRPPSQPAEESTRTVSTIGIGVSPTIVNNNFYGMDRTDAVDISKESIRQVSRS